MAVPPGGALLTCTTSRGDDLRGSVIAMDEKTKVVIIKETTDSTGDSVQIINLHHVSDLKISGHTQLTTPTNLPAINLQKLQQRLEQNGVAKWKNIESRGVCVSERPNSCCI